MKQKENALFVVILVEQKFLRWTLLSLISLGKAIESKLNNIEDPSISVDIKIRQMADYCSPAALSSLYFFSSSSCTFFGTGAW
jgi:hypothetical protein